MATYEYLSWGWPWMDCLLIWQRLFANDSKRSPTAERPLLKTARGA